MRISIVVGDWSDDGHGKTATYQAEQPDGLKESSLDFYFNLAVAKGIPNITSFCEDYEDSAIPTSIAKELEEKVGGDGLFEDGIDDEADETYLNSEDFANVWVRTVNKGIEYNGEEGVVTLVPSSDAKTYEIGGYGLFY